MIMTEICYPDLNHRFLPDWWPCLHRNPRRARTLFLYGGPIDAMGRAARNGNFVAASNDGVPRCPSRTT
jgi:hypothetical protein